MLPHFFQYFLCLLLHLLPALADGGSTAKPLAPALYVFGDSLLDNGNNILLPTLAKANYKPYGVDFPGGATGRFTNGRNAADFIVVELQKALINISRVGVLSATTFLSLKIGYAEYLGIPYPRRVIGLPRSNWLTGFNYASGSCGILDQTGSDYGKCLTLEDQIDLFERTIKKVLRGSLKNPSDVSLHLSKSIFLLSMGSNDYQVNYFDKSDTRERYNSEQFPQLLIDRLSDKLKRLYKLGARKVVFFELGPLGCIPSRAKTTKHDGPCNEEINRIVSLFNDKLRSLLSDLGSTLSGSHFVLGQNFAPSYDTIVNPSKYGFTNTRDSCCKTWFKHSGPCIPFLRPCKDRRRRYFWDSGHVTEAVCSLVASQCINGSSMCVPLNLRQLVLL